jgi:PAS domain S-box-containing protein
MKDLKSFAHYLRTECLRELTVEYLRIVWSLNIPVVKLVIDRKIFPGLTEEKGVELGMAGLDRFLSRIEDGTWFEEAQKAFRQWEENKIEIPGISREDIHPSDLVLVYFAQKKAILKHLPNYTSNAVEITSIIGELEEYYMRAQNEAVQVLFKIQKEYEQQYKDSEEKFRQLVQGVQDYAIILLDAKGNIKSWNEGIERIKGYKAKDVIGQHFSVFYTEEDRKKKLPEHNLAMAKEKGHYESEGWRVRKDGTKFWANTVITAMYDDSGVLRGFSKITRDVTELRRSKEELENKAEELSRSNRELEQFAYVASHDLQEPLRTVSSYVQLLANRYKGKLDKEADEFIEFAVDGSNRMRQLINSLLEYSRINRAKPFEKVDIQAIIEEVLMDLSEQIKISKADIKYSNLPVVQGDPVLIGQVFLNLIGNALKFRSAKPPEIRISAERRNGNYLFSVKDNGIGIDKEYWEKIFVIFQRLNNREQYPGTGIGLSICKKIVEKHGGKMWVESEPGKGSVFYLILKAIAEKSVSQKANSNGKQSEHIAH